MRGKRNGRKGEAEMELEVRNKYEEEEGIMCEPRREKHETAQKERKEEIGEEEKELDK